MSLAAELPDLSDVHVLVVGDVMLDRYWFGGVERISPEAPVPIVKVNEVELRGGGAANVALNVVNLGAQCSLLSVTGDDNHSGDLEQMLSEAGVKANLVKNSQYQTTVKQRVISRNQQLIRLDFEQQPHKPMLDDCMAAYQKLLPSVDAVIFSDYGKGCLTQVDAMIAQAKDNNLPISVDPKGRDYSRYRSASLITPNLSEFEQVVGEVANDDEMDAKAKQLVAQLQLENLLVTLSERGMKLYRSDQKMHYSPARAREVYDVSGAGDTVIACLGTLLASDLAIDEVLEIANAAAGVVVAKLGTAVVTRQEIVESLIRIREQL